MSIFGAYSRYYNLLYKDKDYAGEARHIDSLITAHRPGAASVLDLGCGTGRHDLLLAQKGYQVAGVDQSQEMLAVADASSQSAFLPQGAALDFQQGDIRSVRLGRTFDVVLSLFHVMSYQVSNADLVAAFATARTHLAPGGIFIFDCWYGPAVLTERPQVRVKRLEDEEIAVTRVAEPVMYPNESLVDVNYQVFIRSKGNAEVAELHETHRMRYLFKPEIEQLFAASGMKIVLAQEWMTGRELGFDTWSGCFLGVV